MTINENDIELKILRGSPIDIGIGKIHPLTLDEISQIGELKYNQSLSIITSNKKEFFVDSENLTHFQSIVVLCYHQQEFRELFLESVTAFFKEPVHFHEEGFFYLGDLVDERFIDEVKFNDIQLIIKKQNFLKDEVGKEEFKPHNDKAAELIEKMKQVKSKIKKENDDNGLSLSDIISIVCSYMPNVSIFSVWNLTVYQLYTLYLRLILKDNYESNFYLMPHVSDSKTLDLKHWATKLNK
jgi:uncharacterized protein (UPF0305 family)